MEIAFELHDSGDTATAGIGLDADSIDISGIRAN